MAVNIALLDDHPLLIKGLQTMLQHYSELEVTGAYTSDKELFKALEAGPAELLILDIQMEGQMGDEVAATVRKRFPELMVLVFSHMEQEYYIKAMLNHEVMGYVLKSSPETILLEAIHSIARGTPYFDPAIRKQVARIQRSITRGPALTKREKEVLELIAADYSSQDIAEKLFLSKRTVDNHRINLLLKLDVKGSASLVKKAIDLGLIH